MNIFIHPSVRTEVYDFTSSVLPDADGQLHVIPSMVKTVNLPVSQSGQ
jgi:hypothetical protein